jgi:hypothetical protein
MSSARREAFRRREEHTRGRREEGKVCKVPWLEEAELDVGEHASEMWNGGGVRPPPPPFSSGGYRERAVAVPVESTRATSMDGHGGRSKRWATATAAAGRARAMAVSRSQDLLQKVPNRGRKLRQASSKKVDAEREDLVMAWSSSSRCMILFPF